MNLKKLERPHRSQQDWRETALTMVMEMADAGGYQVSGPEVKEFLSVLGDRYVFRNSAQVKPALPHPIRRFVYSLAELVEAVRGESFTDRRPLILTPEDILLLYGSMIFRDQELLKALFLNEGNHLLGDQDAALGNANRIFVEPKVIMRKALEWEADKLIIIHNHPSGNLDPSDKDVFFTRQMQKASDVLGVRLVDHIIVGKSGKKYFSFAENKIL